MIEINKIYNEHCFDTMSKMEKGSVNLIITLDQKYLRHNVNGHTIEFQH